MASLPDIFVPEMTRGDTIPMKKQGDDHLIYAAISGSWMTYYSTDVSRCEPAVHIEYEPVSHCLGIKRSDRSVARHVVGWGKT